MKLNHLFSITTSLVPSLLLITVILRIFKHLIFIDILHFKLESFLLSKRNLLDHLLIERYRIIHFQFM